MSSSLVANIPPQNRNKDQSHAKSRYILSWHTGELARGCLGTGEAGERRQSSLQKPPEVSTDCPSFSLAGERGDPETGRAGRNSSVGESGGRGFCAKAQKEGLAKGRQAGLQGRGLAAGIWVSGCPAPPPLLCRRTTLSEQSIREAVDQGGPPTRSEVGQADKLGFLEFASKYRTLGRKMPGGMGFTPF